MPKKTIEDQKQLSERLANVALNQQQQYEDIFNENVKLKNEI